MFLVNMDGLYHSKINKERALEKHFQAFFKMVEKNQSIYGLIKAQSSTTNM